MHAHIHEQRAHYSYLRSDVMTTKVFLVQVTLSTDNKGYVKVPFPCFPRLVNPLGVHPEVKCFLLNCSSKNFFTGNYCSKLSVKLISVIYNHSRPLSSVPIEWRWAAPSLSSLTKSGVKLISFQTQDYGERRRSQLTRCSRFQKLRNGSLTNFKDDRN